MTDKPDTKASTQAFEAFCAVVQKHVRDPQAAEAVLFAARMLVLTTIRETGDIRQYDERVDVLRIAIIGACGTLGTAVDMGVPNAATMRDALRALYLDTGGPIE